MDASTSALPRPVEVPAWKSLLSHAGAAVTAFLFVLAGVYKALDPDKFAALAQNLLVPQSLALPLALTLAVLETTSGVLVLGYAYGYFRAKDILRLGLIISLADSLMLLIVVPFYWPLIGIK